MKTPEFTERYNKLNTAQKKAVDIVECPVMVVAGPGTGKTQILTLRIANILLQTHAEPENILALTFTEAAAAEMKRRLSAIIGSQAYGVNIATFHGFCNEVIQTNPDMFNEIIGRTPSDEAIQVRLIQEAIEARGTDGKLRPFRYPSMYIGAVKSAISTLKREGKTPKDLRLLVDEETHRIQNASDFVHEKGAYKGKVKAPYQKRLDQLDKDKELADIYEAYQELLASEHVYDYDDMIMSVSQTLTSNELLLRMLQEQFHYFLVDEHQDTNNAQNQILEFLASFHENPNIFVVGDEKQAIFRFQGASLKNFLYFKEKYPDATLITLTNNYRSSQSILDAAGSMIEKNTQRITQIFTDISDILHAKAQHTSRPIEVFAFERDEDELFFITERITQLISQGVDKREIAIIYRNNKDANSIADLLDKKGIPFKIESKKNILDIPDIRNFLLLMRYIDEFDSDEKLFSVLHIDFLNIQPIDIYKTNRLARIKKLPLIEMLTDENELAEAGITNPAHMNHIASLFSQWRTIAQNRPVTEFFETLVRESGYLVHIMQSDDSADRISRINTLFSEVRSLVEQNPHCTVTNCLRHFTILEEQNIPLKESVGTFIPDAVRCMTAHGAKGLEFEYVFIVRAYDGHWGNKKIRELIVLPNLIEKGDDVQHAHSKNDDERRLFYVAITRAKKQVFISYAKAGDDGTDRIPAQFVEEMHAPLKIEGDTSLYTGQNTERLTLHFAPTLSKKVNAFEKEYITHLFEERGLAATALNNFLECPWRYVYMNLLQMPKAPTVSQAYGTAVHAAMRTYFDACRGGEAKKELLTKTFEESTKNTILEREENKSVITKGKEALSGYHDYYKNTWITDTKNEMSIRGVMIPKKDGLPQIRLTGKLDKLEFSQNGNINVVDYKTGKTRTRNDLEGKTQQGTGDYVRQLVFYKILLDASGPYRGRMESGEIDFIEPNKKGTYQKEKFFIDTKKTEELMNQIYDVAEKIMTVSFADERCGNKDCEFCRLRDGMV
ncbi:MAG: ATP-dependent DNA helicase [bacterium]